MAFPLRAPWIGAVVALACASAASPAIALDSVYVANTGESSVSQFEVDGAGGLVPMSPAKVGASGSPSSITASPDGASVYMATVNSGGIWQYSVGEDGKLTPKSPPTQASGPCLNGIAANPDGKSVYAVDACESAIYQYDVLAGGVLSPKATPKVVTSGLFGMLAVSPDGKAAYAPANTNGQINSGRVHQYTVNPDGSLVPKAPASFVATGANTTSVAVNPDGKSLYAANTSNKTISQYDVNPDGTLVAKSPATVPTTQYPSAFATSKDGTTVYVTTYGNDQAHDDGGIAQFSAGTNGALSPKSPATAAAGPDPRGAVLSSDGAHLYSPIRASTDVPSQNGVFQYDVGAGGTLTPMSPSLVPAGARPTGIALSPIRQPPQPPTGGAGGGAVQRTRITSGPSGVTSAAPTFTFVSDDPAAAFECRFDDEPFRPCRTPHTRYGLKLGPHTFHVRSLADDDLGDSRSFTLAVLTEDKGCTVFADVDPAPGQDECIVFGDCPRNAECRLDEMVIDSTDPKQMGFGFVRIAVCRRTSQLGNPKYCHIRYDQKLNETWCYFPSAGAATHNAACPTKQRNQYVDRQPPVTRHVTVCTLLQQLRGGVGQATCTARFRIKPADPFAFVGGGGGQLGTFASGPGTLTIAAGSSGNARVSVAATRAKPFKTIRKTVKQEGWVTIQPKLSRQAAATLRRRKKLKLPIRITFVPKEGERIVRTTRVTLTTAPCRVDSPKRSGGKLLPPKRRCR